MRMILQSGGSYGFRMTAIEEKTCYSTEIPQLALVSFHQKKKMMLL